MTKRISLVLALLLVLCLFAGCGGNQSTGNAGDDAQNGGSAGAGADNSQDDSGAASAQPTETQADADYLFAAGNYETDENGWPLDYYEYDSPFCNTDEVLTYWTTVWYPQYLPEEGLGGIDFCQAEEKVTGVHIEYLVIDAWTGRNENFAALLASDDLPDIMNQADNYYPGSIREGVDSGYFANIYDYREYAPNYFFFVFDHDDDPNLYDQVFLEDDLVPTFLQFNSRILPAYGTVGIRGDWLDEQGIKLDDIDTVDDYTMLGELFKVQYGCEMAVDLVTNQIDMPMFFTCYDTYTCLASSYNNTFPGAYAPDGKVHFYYSDDNAKNFVQQMVEWMEAGFLDPNFMAPDYSTNPCWTQKCGVYCMTPSWIKTYNENCEDPDCDWRIAKKVNLYEGQVHKLGRTNGYYNSGKSQISAKCENIPLAVSWCDWRYSKSGAFLCSYGVEGTTWEYNENGVPEATDFIYNNPDGLDFTYGMTIYAFNYFAEHGLKLSEAEYCYPGGEKAFDMFDYFMQYEYSGEWEWPKGVSLTEDQSREFATVGGDISTYITENVALFINLDRPMSEWDDYVQGLYDMGLQRALDIYQEAYDAYKAKVAARNAA